MANKLLDLDTLSDRDHILIDGQRYELYNSDELSFVDLAQLEREGKTLAELMNRSAELDADEASELDRLTFRLLDLVSVDMPREVAERLTQTQRFRVVNAFTQRSATRKGTGRSKKKTTKGRTPASKQRASSDSTAATPSGG